MGFFSWNCKCCGKSIVSPYSPKQIDWMNKITMVMDTGEVIQGEYDGYGNIYNRTDEHRWGDNWDIDENAESICLDNEHQATFYHTACYEESGKPGFQGQNDSANDQGFFLDEKDYADCVPTNAS